MTHKYHQTQDVLSTFSKNYGKFAYPLALLLAYSIIGFFASLSIFLIGGNILGALNVYSPESYITLFVLSMAVFLYLLSSLIAGTLKGVEKALHGKRITLKEYFFSSFYNSPKAFGIVLIKLALCLISAFLAYYLTSFLFADVFQLPGILVLIIILSILLLIIDLPLVLALPSAVVFEKKDILFSLKNSFHALKKSPLEIVLLSISKGIIFLLMLVPLLGLLPYFILLPLWMGFAIEKTYSLRM